jgi:hypothetical protein
MKGEMQGMDSRRNAIEIATVMEGTGPHSEEVTDQEV